MYSANGVETPSGGRISPPEDTAASFVTVRRRPTREPERRVTNRDGGALAVYNPVETRPGHETVEHAVIIKDAKQFFVHRQEMRFDRGFIRQ
ncbi:hypothetical protein C439_18878 [Haloferax mediterranei ATCC 33500]|uniref:Uncharacterized protein n=1 Tax=Haloferax mediterranei (strain ATCC 33500 / DSM 1411 / JCM 8866 / NBRC 14739 / NCIMB 2177 / R-4) TaxID=523841 RepID=M0IKT6_HALMT|nr:hypothetical protein C439_18878 [Haloferax mediterranei ATCC 33500]